MNKSKHGIVFILLIIFLNSCGVNIIEEQDCIPKVSYESTKSVKMFLVEVTDSEFSYSELKIKNEERFLCLSVPNMIDCNDDFGSLSISELPLGTKVNLTGTVKRIEPYGFSSAFKSDMTYLQGTVNDIVVWIPLFRLSSFAEYESESTINYNSNKILGINDSTYVVLGFDCFD